MNHNRITNLPKVIDNEDAASVAWVKENTVTSSWVDTRIDSKIPRGLHRLVAFVKGSPDSHTVEYKDDSVLMIVWRKVGANKQLEFIFKDDLPNGFYTYDFDIQRNGSDGKGLDILLYGECGGAGYDSKVTYRFWAANKGTTGRDFSVSKSSGKGKRFLRMYGNNAQIHGQFELKGHHVYNHGKPYTVNIDGTNGETYEALTQHVTLNMSGITGNKLIGGSLIFIFQPDDNAVTNIEVSSEFKLFRLS